jgi:hypothetical protein
VPKRKAGDSEKRSPYVGLSNEQIDSMAFKTLSPNAVWLFVQIKRAWNGDDQRIALPFARVSWKLTFKAFDEARRELVQAGFVRIVSPGGLNEGGLRNAAVYALSDGWRGEVAKRLAKEDGTWYTKNVRSRDGRLVSIYYPARPRSGRQKAADRARMVKMSKAKGAKKPALIKSKKKDHIPKVYLNRVRVAKLLEDGGALGKARELRNRN